MTKTTLSVRVDEALKQQLTAHAAAAGMGTVSAHAIRAIELYLMNGGESAQFELLDRVAGLESKVRELERRVRNLDAYLE